MRERKAFAFSAVFDATKLWRRGICRHRINNPTE
jgi:hypothetical protein